MPDTLFADALLTPELRNLRALFVARGFDLRFVGGAVRALLAGETPSDIDLCTDADPTEQVAIYVANDVRHYLTGIQHGTVTVGVGCDTVEITSLRTETGHDGRWADVSYTRDWRADLSRRDLTINAMALSFDNRLFDPFGGRGDLLANTVRFVGDPDERLREDFLRLLRWVRFLGRYGGETIDPTTAAAVRRNAGGLAGISRERVWQEMSKTVSGDRGPDMLGVALDCGLGGPSGLLVGFTGPNDPDLAAGRAALTLAHRHTRDPATLFGCLLGTPDRVAALARDWRWSRAEAGLASYVVGWRNGDLDAAKRLLAVDGHPVEHVRQAFLARGQRGEADAIAAWVVPACPVTGRDLSTRGMKSGPGMGAALNRLRASWAASDYRMDRTDLLELL